MNVKLELADIESRVISQVDFFKIKEEQTAILKKIVESIGQSKAIDIAGRAATIHYALGKRENAPLDNIVEVIENLLPVLKDSIKRERK